MPKVIPYEGETMEETLKRFRFKVVKSGIFGEIKKRKFYLTKSQKRREKSKKARKRERRKNRILRYNDRDFKPWVTDTTWPPDMTKRPDSAGSEKSYFHRSNPDLIQEEPSFFVFAIATFETPDSDLITVLVKDDPKNNDSKGQSGRWGFPGGGVKPDETLEDGAVREYKEESGLKIRKPTSRNIIFEVKIGLHTSVGYRTQIVGGELVKGDEIKDIAVVKLADLKQWASSGLLLPKHCKAAEALLRQLKI